MILFEHFKNSAHVGLKFSKLNGSRYRYFDFFRIFFVRFFFSIPIIRNLQKINKLNNDIIIQDEKYFNSQLKLGEVLKELDHNGYFANLSINAETLSTIKSEINNENCFLELKNTLKQLYNSKKNKFDYSNINHENVDFHQVKFKNLNELVSFSSKRKIKHLSVGFKQNDNIIKKIACSKIFLPIAKKYLNSNNLTCKIKCYISNPIKSSVDDMKTYAQYYHYDLDYKKFMKFFIYLNDVDLNTGPHVIIEKTHRKKMFKHILAERLSDEEVIKCYGAEREKKITGNAGSVLIEDTFTLHKGSFPISKTRCVLIFEFGLGKSILKNDQYIYI